MPGCSIEYCRCDIPLSSNEEKTSHKEEKNLPCFYWPEKSPWTKYLALHFDGLWGRWKLMNGLLGLWELVRLGKFKSESKRLFGWEVWSNCCWPPRVCFKPVTFCYCVGNFLSWVKFWLSIEGPIFI